MLVPVTNLSQETSWQQALSSVVDDGAALLRMLGLSADEVGLSEAAAKQFPVRTTRSFVSRMQRGNPSDPLLLQVLATAKEQELTAGYSADPVGEVANANTASGLLQKYRGRVLLLVSGACAIHCRYCFRRHFPYDENRNSRADWDNAIDRIAKDASIAEVIFSGGDPLVASDSQLAYLVQRLACIPHIKRLRIHSRLPVVLPQRVTAPLLKAITTSDMRTTMVIHANHAQEIDSEVRQAMDRLSNNGVSLLNQAVLLAGVNDSVSDQVALSETLYDAGVLPYYLHLLDKVAGASHFDVPLEDGLAIHRELHAALPGYLVPRLVKEEAGAPGKTLIG